MRPISTMGGSKQSNESRASDAEAALDGLRVSIDILERVAIETDVMPPLKKRVDACMREFLTLPLPQQPAFEGAIAALERSLEEVGHAVHEADLAVPFGTFRRKLDPGSFQPMQLAAYARTMATSPFGGGPRQERFLLAVTHALAAMTPGHRLEARPSTEIEAALDVVLEGLVGDPSKRSDTLAILEGASAKLTTFQSADQMFEANFDRDVKRFKKGLGEALLDREILKALVRFEIAFQGQQLAIPASNHRMSIPPGAGGKPPLLSASRPNLMAAVAASLRPPPPPPPKERTDTGGLSALLNEALDEAGSTGEDPLGGSIAVPSAPELVSEFGELAGELEPDAEEGEEEGPDEDQIAAISDLLDILKELGAEADHVKVVEQAVAACTGGFEGLGKLDSKGYAERLSAYEEALGVGEETALDVDAAISMNAFRSWYDRTPRPQEVLLRYASLLGGARRLKDVQRDRLEFVVTRLISKKVDDERLAMSPRAEAAPILDYVIRRRPAIKDHERSDAVMFFRDASLQLTNLHSLDDVFKGGFYLDVRGYKVALRDQLLDPDVLYAAVALNAAIHNRIEEMRELEARSKNSLHGMLGKDDEEVRKVFMKRASLRTDERFEETRRYLEKYRQNVEKGTTRTKMSRRTMNRLLLSGGIGATGLGALKLILREINTVRALSATELERLSPILESGGFSEGESESVFMGQVASEAWLALSAEERSSAAEELRDALRRRTVRAAWITRGENQAIHIANSVVVSVE